MEPLLFQFSESPERHLRFGFLFQNPKKMNFSPKIVIDAEILFRQRYYHDVITMAETSQVDV